MSNELGRFKEEPQEDGFKAIDRLVEIAEELRNNPPERPNAIGGSIRKVSIGGNTFSVDRNQNYTSVESALWVEVFYSKDKKERHALTSCRNNTEKPQLFYSKFDDENLWSEWELMK